jgi:arabinofuranan 3-O-arabinosyltransferase
LIASPLVSIVVPTKNSEATLEDCLRSIRAQTYSPLEIVIVDACSTDGTRDISEKYADKVIEAIAGRSEARNLGAKESKGEFLYFVDADNVLEPNVVSACMAQIRRKADAVIVPELSVGQGFWARCKALEKRCYIDDGAVEAARFFKRRLFEMVGGFDVFLEAGEDWDLNLRVQKAGAKVGRINAFAKHYDGRLDLLQTMKKKYHYGKTILRYQKKYPRRAFVQLQLVRPSFFRNSQALTDGFRVFLGMVFMKVCEFSAGGLGVLSSGVKNLLRKSRG